jgi:hypothetical protein
MACTAPNINPNWDCKAKARVLFQQWWLHTQKAKHACHFGGDAVLANVTAAPTRAVNASSALQVPSRHRAGVLSKTKCGAIGAWSWCVRTWPRLMDQGAVRLEHRRH